MTRTASSRKSVVGYGSKPELRALRSVAPSAYNPRNTDPARLKLIELSLRKLGWLIPVYASPGGEILSGHQRQLAAEAMGLKLIPVSYTKPMALEDRKAVNIVFNRGTNDLEPWETPKNLTEALERSNVLELADRLPDIGPTEYRFFRCIQMRPTPIRDLLRVNSGHWKQYAANVARTLQLKGIVMPIIATKDLRVVNGIGRLQMLAEQKARTAGVYAAASSTKQTDWESLRGKQFPNRKNERTIAFALEYERGIKLGEFGARPKVQKYHTTEEFTALFRECFEEVKVGHSCNNVEAICRRPKPVDPKSLAAALAFEFDLPYPDGTRMGLAREAAAAFKKRLGVRA